jgi:EmrB/QacA subfamily drug resistance transporter
LSPVSRRWVLLAAILGSGVVFLDGTVVTVAMARIGHDLPSHVLGTLEAQTYLYNGYLLALSAALVPAGAAGDNYGRRRMFLWGLIGFGASSLLCGIAPNIEALILFRLVQGLSGALLVPGSLALIRVNFPDKEQGRAIGIWSAGTSLTVLAGPLAGGLLVDLVSWRAVFLVNLPLIAAAVVATSRHVPESHDENARGLDWVGAILFALAAGGLSFGTIYGQSHSWSSPLAWASLTVGVAATLALPAWLRRARHPLIPPALFAIRAFTVVNIATLLIYGALYVWGYYQPLFLQGIAGWTAVQAGLTSIPGSILLIALSPRVGALTARIGTRPFLVAGPALMAMGLLYLIRLPQAPNYLIDILPATLLASLGIGILVTPLTTALMSSVDADHAGVASAFNNALSRVGPQLAGAVVFVAVEAVFFAQLGAHPAGVSPLNRPANPVWVGPAQAASTSAFHLAMLVCAGLLVAGSLVSLFGLAPGAVRGKQEELRAAS